MPLQYQLLNFSNKGHLRFARNVGTLNSAHPTLYCSKKQQEEGTSDPPKIDEDDFPITSSYWKWIYPFSRICRREAHFSSTKTR